MSSVALVTNGELIEIVTGLEPQSKVMWPPAANAVRKLASVQVVMTVGLTSVTGWMGGVQTVSVTAVAPIGAAREESGTVPTSKTSKATNPIKYHLNRMIILIFHRKAREGRKG
jgi:hypothetical protein